MSLEVICNYFRKKKKGKKKRKKKKEKRKRTALTAHRVGIVKAEPIKILL